MLLQIDRKLFGEKALNRPSRLGIAKLLLGLSLKLRL